MKLDQNYKVKEQIRNVHSCDNHADESYTVAMITNIIKMYELSISDTNVLPKCADIAED